MSESPNDDYCQVPVPPGQGQSSPRIALIIIGGTIGIPIFILGAQMGGSLGFVDAVKAFFFGAVILGAMMFCTSWVGGHSRVSTYKLVEAAFGFSGAKLSNAVIALTLAGWYGINCKMFGMATDKVMLSLGVELPVNLYMVIGSLLMLFVSLKGFKGIDKLALYLVPLMVLFIIYAVKLSLDSPDIDRLWVKNNDLSLLEAISAVVGAYIVGAVIQPDYSRFAAQPKSASIGAFVALGITFPIVLLLVCIPAVITNQSDIILVMLNIGIGIPAFLLLLLSSWSSNVLCLYSASLSINTIVPAVSMTRINIAIATIGTLIAFADVQQYFISFLIILGICIPPIGAIYCLQWFYRRHEQPHKTINWISMTAWFAGCTSGFINYFQWGTISGIATLDAIICSIMTFVVIQFGRRLLATEKLRENNE